MLAPNDLLSALLDDVAERVSAKILGRLEHRPPERVPLKDVAGRYGVTDRWIQEQRRKGRVEIHGPRGARFVFANELEALLTTTTIARMIPAQAAGPRDGSDLVADARGAVAALAKRRANR